MKKVIKVLHDNGFNVEICNGIEYAKGLPSNVLETYKEEIEAKGSIAEKQFFLTVNIAHENRDIIIVADKSKAKTIYKYFPDALTGKFTIMDKVQLIRELREI